MSYNRSRKNKKDPKKRAFPEILVLEVHLHQGKPSFKPLRFDHDPLLTSRKDQRSLRLFTPNPNPSGPKLQEGDLWVVQVTDSKILEKMSQEGRHIIKTDVTILAKQTGISYISRISKETVEKAFVFGDNEPALLEAYLSSGFLNIEAVNA